MTTRKYTLTALLVTAAVMGSISVTEAFATTINGPTYDSQDEEEIGAISYMTSTSTNSQDGEGSFRAFRDSGISVAGQASNEYRIEVTVAAGDDLEIDVFGASDYVRFYGSSNNSHLAVHPTVYLQSTGQHGDIAAGCSNLSFVAIENNVYSYTPMIGSLTCNNLAPGDYYVSAYVHARTDNVQNSQVRGDFEDVDIEIIVS